MSVLTSQSSQLLDHATQISVPQLPQKIQWIVGQYSEYSLLSSLSTQTADYSASHQVSILRNFVEGTCAFVRECVKKVRLFIVET